MFKLSEIIKKSDAEKLEQLKKKLKKQQSPREAVFILRTKIDHRLHDGQVKNKLLKDSP